MQAKHTLKTKYSSVLNKNFDRFLVDFLNFYKGIIYMSSNVFAWRKQLSDLRQLSVLIQTRTISFGQSLMSPLKKVHQVCPVFQAHHQHWNPWMSDDGFLPWHMVSISELRILESSPQSGFRTSCTNHKKVPHASVMDSSPAPGINNDFLHSHGVLCVPLVTIELPSPSVDSILLTVVSLIYRVDLMSQGSLSNIP